MSFEHIFSYTKEITELKTLLGDVLTKYCVTHNREASNAIERFLERFELLFTYSKRVVETKKSNALLLILGAMTEYEGRACIDNLGTHTR